MYMVAVTLSSVLRWVVHPMPQLISAIFGHSSRGDEVGGKPSWV